MGLPSDGRRATYLVVFSVGWVRAAAAALSCRLIDHAHPCGALAQHGKYFTMNSPLKPVDPAAAPVSVSVRTRKALAEARERGVQLGTAGADNIRATVEKRKAAADVFAQAHKAVFAELQGRGLTHRAMATELNQRGIAAAKGGEWTHGQVQRMLNRLADKSVSEG